MGHMFNLGAEGARARAGGLDGAWARPVTNKSPAASARSADAAGDSFVTGGARADIATAVTSSGAFGAASRKRFFGAFRVSGWPLPSWGVMTYARKRVIARPGWSPCGVFLCSEKRTGVGKPM